MIVAASATLDISRFSLSHCLFRRQVSDAERILLPAINPTAIANDTGRDSLKRYNRSPLPV